jgi:acyl carrier protein
MTLMHPPTHQALWHDITAVITEVLADRGEEPGQLTEATTLNADLGISSVEAMHVMVLLEDRLGRPLHFQDLAVQNGEYVSDLTLGAIRDFITGAMGT